MVKTFGVKRGGRGSFGGSRRGGRGGLHTRAQPKYY